MNKIDIYAELEKRNAAKCVVKFSGGNDEGGADEITLFDAADNPIGKIEMYGDVTAEDRALAEALSDPIYQRWGGFGGVPQVYGTLTYDVATRTKKMRGEESVMQEFEF